MAGFRGAGSDAGGAGQGEARSRVRPARRPRACAPGRALGALAAVVAPMVLACSPGGDTQRAALPADGARVVVTIVPVALLAAPLVSARVAVEVLVPPGASPHGYEPRPSDVARLASADLFVRVGGSLDGWAARLLDRVATPPASLALLEVPGLELRGLHGEAFRPDAEPDPHVWLDPIRVRDRLLPALARPLAGVDPGGPPAVEGRLEVFRGELTELDRVIRSLLAEVPTRAFLSFHPTWGYFAERYGLRELAALEEAPGRPPSPAALARLTVLARREGVRAVLLEPQLDPRVGRALAREIGVATVVADPLGDPRDPERSSYVGLMRFNARAFRRALGGGSGP